MEDGKRERERERDWEEGDGICISKSSFFVSQLCEIITSNTGNSRHILRNRGGLS